MATMMDRIWRPFLCENGISTGRKVENTKKWAQLLFVLTTLALVLPDRVRAWDEDSFAQKKLTEHRFVLPENSDNFRTKTVIGTPTEYQISKKDTLLDIARYFGLGYNEITAAYPQIDPWLPPADQTMVIPTFWVLPKSGHTGVVVNIPEMRLYYFLPVQKGFTDRTVITLPTGMGREDWPTPQAKFTIRGKTMNPTWVIPESIKKERIADKGWTEDRIAGGAPDNPLGKHRVELTLPLYSIHGTNNPWAVGRLVTHGCIRLYPEDMENFFDLVKVGSPGEFTYQPIKIGMLYGKVYAEVHDDIYNLIPDLWGEAQRVVQESGWADLVDQTLLTKVLMAKTGTPVDISKGSLPVSIAELTPRQIDDNLEALSSRPKARQRKKPADETVYATDDEEIGPSEQIGQRGEDKLEQQADAEKPELERLSSVQITVPRNNVEKVQSSSRAVKRNGPEPSGGPADTAGDEPTVKGVIIGIMRDAMEFLPPVSSSKENKGEERPEPQVQQKDRHAGQEQPNPQDQQDQGDHSDGEDTAYLVNYMPLWQDDAPEKELGSGDTYGVRHIRRVQPLTPDTQFNMRSYFDTLSDWEFGAGHGIDDPHHEEIRSP
jgi:L,D-transpeptidase ErfK/SrfK